MDSRKRQGLAFFLIIGLSIGFAFLSTSLNMLGQTTVARTSWDVHFENVQVSEDSVYASTPKIDENETTVSYNVHLDLPGDFYEFCVDAVNDGTLDAEIETFTSTEIDSRVLQYLSYSVTYSDGEEIGEHDVLEAGTSATYKVRVEYMKDIEASDLNEVGVDLELSFSVIYIKYDEPAISLWQFDYKNGEDEFTVPYDGNYRLEVWGAQGGMVVGGANGGYGGYSIGSIHLNKNQTLYINVGGKGNNNPKVANNIVAKGGYNGGGDAGSDGYTSWSAGGGATHIALVSGKLSTLESHKNDNKILIVAGAGGGSGWFPYFDYEANAGGSGGGYIGGNGTGKWYGVGGNQNTGGHATGTSDEGQNSKIQSGTFGQGSSYFNYSTSSSPTPRGGGGGGGYYGGGSGYSAGSSAAGGSGYIGNTNLYDKAMYCYQCSTSNVESTKTISTNNVSEEPISGYAKKEDGYAKIIYIGK